MNGGWRCVGRASGKASKMAGGVVLGERVVRRVRWQVALCWASEW